MNVFHRVAQRSMRANRMRTIVTIIGVILSAAMFTAVTTFATTLLTHLQRVTAYLDGAYYLGVHNVDADTLASMRADSDIEAFSTAEVLGYAEVTVNNSNKPYLYVEAIDAGFSDRMPVHLVEGRMPENGTELLIPDHLQAYSDAGTYLVGDTLTLELGDRYSGGWRLWQNNGFQPEGDESADPGLTDEPEQPEQLLARETRTYTIVGVYQRPNFEDYSAPGFSALTVQENEPQTGLYDVYLLLRDAKQETLDRVMARYSDAAEGGISMNWDYLRTQGNFRYDNYSRFLLMFVIIFVLLIMLGSVSLIYSAFSISVSERTAVRPAGVHRRDAGAAPPDGLCRGRDGRAHRHSARPACGLRRYVGDDPPAEPTHFRYDRRARGRDAVCRLAAVPAGGGPDRAGDGFPLGADPGAACHAHFAHRGHPPEPRRARGGKTRRLRPPELPPVRPAGPAFQPLFPPQP